MPYSNLQNNINWGSAAYAFPVDDILQDAVEQPKFAEQPIYNMDQLLDFNFPNLTPSPIETQQSIPTTSSVSRPLASEFSVPTAWQSTSISQSPEVWPTSATECFATPSWNVTPTTAHSPTPSLSDDSPVDSENEDSKPCIIQHTFSTKSSHSKSSSTAKAMSSQHRDRQSSQSSSIASRTPIQKQTPTNRRRQPHNQVERKYREGLNQQLTNLRHAVPTLLPSFDADGNPTPIKTSKAAILATAIEYIKSVEAERDALQRQVEILRGMRM